MKIQHKIVGVSIIFGVFIWMIDAVLDFYFFQEGTFLEVLVYDVHPHHLYIRLVGIGSFLIFGIIIAKVMALRKKANEAEERAHAELNQIFNASVPLCVIDKNFKMLRVNDTFCSFFGMKRKKIIGEKCCDIWKGPFCNTPECPMEQIQSGMEQSEHEVVDKKLSDGRTISCIVTAIPYRSPTGEFFGIVENFTDITERNQTEEAMKIRDIALESSINAVGFVALDGTILYINNSWLKMWGYEHKKEVLGIDSLSFWLEKDKVLNVTQELYNKGSWVGELVGVKKNGSTFDVQLSGHMVKNNEGKPIIMMATFLDITERKQAEAELKNHRFHLEKMVNERTNELKTANEQLQKQAQIIDQIHDSVISTDMDGYVTSWNKGAERLFGYSEKEALGKHISFVYPEGEHEFLKQMVIVPLKEKGFHEVEVRMQKKTGEDFYAQLSLSVIKDSSAILTGMIGYSMDITERKKNVEELQKMEKLEAVGVLAGGIAHDFNNLLTAILGNLSLAELHVRPGDNAYESLMRAKNASQHAGKLTQQLLTFSKGGAPIKETAGNR